LSKDTYDARLSVEQPILDLTVGPRRGVERARLAESEAEVRSALYRLRREVNDAFFSAALLDERGRLIEATLADLEGRLQEARVRVREGAALPGDTAAIRATLLERRQDQDRVEADRRAALTRLSELIGQPVPDPAPLALPDLAAPAAEARDHVAGLRVHPEYDRLARTRERLTRQEAVVAAGQRPRVSAFGRAGYGRPGLNPVLDQFDSYYVFGLQVRWAPWTWGSTGREREALALQREIVASEEAAFAGSLARAVQGDLADMDRLERALALDQEIVALRERVEREARLRFTEGVMTATEYLDRSTDALEARLARSAHRVEQVQARARLLNTLGVEIR
jgi:outer membrane protein TolC